MSVTVGMDSSIIVKWFKKGEEHEKEALKLRDDTLSAIVNPILSEWIYLEVVRALVKAKYPKAKIIQSYKTLKEMAELDFLRIMPTSSLLEKAKDLEIELNLYASDAVNLSAAVLSSKDMLTEDKHLLQKSVKDFMEKLGLKISKLDEFYLALP